MRRITCMLSRCHPAPTYRIPHLSPGERIIHRSDALRCCCDFKQHRPALFQALVPNSPAIGGATMHLSGISAFAAPALPTAPRPLPEAGMIQVGDQQQKVCRREGGRGRQQESEAGGGRGRGREGGAAWGSRGSEEGRAALQAVGGGRDRRERGSRSEEGEWQQEGRRGRDSRSEATKQAIKPPYSSHDHQQSTHVPQPSHHNT